MLLVVAACDGTPARTAPPSTFTLYVVDEAGDGVITSSLAIVGRPLPVKVAGSAQISLDQPVAGVLSADGYLTEPVVLDPSQQSATVQLLAAVGPNGQQRRVMQFGGDVMMGRRYQTGGENPSTAVAKSAKQARDVVRWVAPLMAAADASMVNLETVVGELPTLDAYPGKRFLLQSPPIVLDALDEMGIDLVTLGNNHAYDWQQGGVESTIAALDDAGMAWAGAGTDATQAQAGRMLDVNGMHVGVVSATTVNGDFVNDSLPGADEEQPSDVLAGDEWQYEARPFGFGSAGDDAYVQPENRRAGEMWKVFSELEDRVDPLLSAQVWLAIADVYPELQDWVARRGHGGAAQFRTAAVTEQVDALRSAGAGLVVVQLHGGFQFSEVPSEFLRRAAHNAIDAGADIVVAHHPHVLQGFEWYRGHLIAYSLGNFVFDQDFLSTFPSAILRTVWEGTRLLQVRVVPLAINDYRPVPVTGEAAQRVLRQMNASSLIEASSDRLRPDLVTNVATTDVSASAGVRPDGATALVTRLPTPVSDTRSIAKGEVVELDACSVVRADNADGAESEIGFDLLSWGTLDDLTADGSAQGGEVWTWDERAQLRYAADRGTYLHLEATANESSLARQVARSALPAHRWYDAEAKPLDGEPRYTLQLDALRMEEPGEIRLVLYDVNDTNPTVEPTSTALHQATVPLPRATIGEWHTLTVDLAEVLNAEFNGVRPEALLLYVAAPPGGNRLDIDNVRLYEWRSVADLPPGVWSSADAIRAGITGDATFDVLGCQ